MSLKMPIAAPNGKRFIQEALTELKIHARLEEKIFYPAVRSHVGKDLMNEADEEHRVAKVLIAELDTGHADNEHRDAKFTVLAESEGGVPPDAEHAMMKKAGSKADSPAAAARKRGTTARSKSSAASKSRTRAAH